MYRYEPLAGVLILGGGEKVEPKKVEQKKSLKVRIEELEEKVFWMHFKGRIIVIWGLFSIGVLFAVTWLWIL